MASEQVAKAIIPDDSTKGFATIFLEKYEGMENELKTAKLENDDYRRELTTQDNQIAFLKSEVARVNEIKDRYMRYSVELSAQLQFLISGTMRALKIAQSVQMSLATEQKANGGANIPPVMDADQAELERIMQSLAAKAVPGTSACAPPPPAQADDPPGNYEASGDDDPVTAVTITGQQLTARPNDIS